MRMAGSTAMRRSRLLKTPSLRIVFRIPLDFPLEFREDPNENNSVRFRLPFIIFKRIEFCHETGVSFEHVK